MPHKFYGFDGDDSCEVCNKFTEDCICPPCPGCTIQGNPGCYEEPDDCNCGGLFGKKTLEQKIASFEWEVAELYRNWQEATLALDWMRQALVEQREREAQNNAQNKAQNNS